MAKARYLNGERVDVQAIARELGLGRVTMHRWFQTRERLLGEAIAEISEERLLKLREQTRRRGAEGLLTIFDRFNKEIASTSGLRMLLEHDNERALRLLTSGSGEVQPRIVATIKRLIEDEVERGYEPLIDPGFLAYGIVRLGEAFLYNDTIIGVRDDTESLKGIQAVLLGLRGHGSAVKVRRGAAAAKRKRAPTRGARTR